LIQILPFRAYDSKLQVTRDFRLELFETSVGLMEDRHIQKLQEGSLWSADKAKLKLEIPSK